MWQKIPAEKLKTIPRKSLIASVLGFQESNDQEKEIK